ncbi:MAG: ABC transporter substrate-binding protein [Chloroflexota bacterium]
MKRFKQILLLIFVGLMACQTAVPSTEPRLVTSWEATAQPERTPLPTPTSMPTGTAVPALPTLAPTVAWAEVPPVPTLPPAAVPENVYVREDSGFTLRHPLNWTIDESDGFTLVDEQLGIFLTHEFQFIDDTISYDIIRDAYLENEEGFENSAVRYEDTLETDSRETAQIALVVSELNGQEIGFWLAYVDHGAKASIFVGIGRAKNIAAREATMRAIVAQAHPGGERIYGLERSETLVLLGGEPHPESLDPARTQGSAAGHVGLLYSGLVRLTPELQVVPDLAENWAVSEDGTVYTFTLREGLMFANERPLTTADVVYSWERASDPDLDSHTVGTYLGDILGMSEKLAGEADSIAGLEIIDDQTLQVTLDGPKPYFLAKLTYPVSYVVDRRSVRESRPNEWVYEPNPSGPYTLADYRELETMIFARNEAYHTPRAIANVVYLSSLVGNRLSIYEANEVDLIYVGGTDALDVRRPSHELHDEWLTNTSMCTTMLMLDNTAAPLDDVNVRHALAWAVNKEGLNELLSEGTSLAAETILPPAMPGYAVGLAQAQAALTYQQEAARTALAESVYANNMPPIVIHASGFGDTERDDLNALVSNWQEVLGIEVQIAFIEPTNYNEVLADEEGNIVSYGWCADYPDPENFLDVLFHSDSEFNVSGYSNEQVDTLLEAARVELDPAVRVSLYQEIERILLDEQAAIPLLHNVSDVLVKPHVQNFVLAPLGAQVVPLLSLAEGEE